MPEVPGRAVLRIGRQGTTGDLADDVGATAGEPIRVREGHQGLGVVRLTLDHALVHGASNLVELAVRLHGRHELGGRRRGLADGIEGREELGDVAILPISFHAGRNGGARVLRRSNHAENYRATAAPGTGAGR